MPNVKFVRPELMRMTKTYETIADAIMGEEQVKYRKSRYLPIPNSSDTSEENVARYNDYLLRAVFYNVTGRTLESLVGQIFIRRPTITVPPRLEPVVEDATGLGIDLEQLSKMTVEEDMSKGRAGLFVDYPTVGEGGATQTDVESGRVRPTINKIEPHRIINWRYEKTGGRKKLLLVVFTEQFIKSDDGFALTFGWQERVLRIDESGQYRNEVYRENKFVEGTTPTDFEGKPFDEIPFQFVGAKNNDPDIDPAPMYHLASVNMAHYRNSADHEESVYLVGQPTVFFSGLTEDWVNKILGKTVMFGSRRILPLPANASAGLLQANPNTMAFEAMKHKEAQMVALGAKLIEGQQVQRTAFDAALANTSENSTLSSVAKNVATAFLWALRWAARFTGDAGSNSLVFDLNTEFDLVNLSPQERLQLMQEWQSHAITWGEYRANLKRAGIASEEDAAAWTKVQDEAKTLAAMNPPKQPAGVREPGSPAGGQNGPKA